MLENILKSAGDFILDLLFPKLCQNCGKEGEYLCAACFEKIELNEKFYCVFCKKPEPFAKTCQSCLSESPLKAVFVAADYNNKILQNLIHCLKYNYLQEIAEILAKLQIRYLEHNKIFENLEINSENSFLAPVPLHRKRYLNRGFNQSEILAKHLGSYLKIEVKNILVRRKNTESQINLKRQERQNNVRGAFLTEGIEALDKNKKIILIDDVVTTGSTLNECAKALRQSGFSEIYGLVVAQRED